MATIQDQITSWQIDDKTITVLGDPIVNSNLNTASFNLKVEEGGVEITPSTLNPITIVGLPKGERYGKDPKEARLMVIKEHMEGYKWQQ